MSLFFKIIKEGFFVPILQLSSSPDIPQIGLFPKPCCANYDGPSAAVVWSFPLLPPQLFSCLRENRPNSVGATAEPTWWTAAVTKGRPVNVSHHFRPVTCILDGSSNSGPLFSFSTQLVKGKVSTHIAPPSPN